MTTTTDVDLVAAWTGGDSSALAAVYDRYAPGLYDTARAMLSDSHDAADLVQDVFCIAAERIGQLREPDRLKAWLYAILRHEVYRRSKKRRRVVPTDFQDERTPDVAAPDDPHTGVEAVAHAELAALVRSAATGLDERDRLVLELSVRRGLSGADLADALGVTPEQSYSLVHRMRDRVEKSLGAFVVAEAGRRDCPRLDALLRDWDGHFTVLVRKRVNRHIEECETCADGRRRLAPLALYGTAPAFALPVGLRTRVLDAANVAPGSGNIGSSGGHWSRSGFPRLGRLGRRAAAWIVSATAVTTLVGIGFVAARGGDDARSPFADDPAAPLATVADGALVAVTDPSGPGPFASDPLSPVTVEPTTTLPATISSTSVAPDVTTTVATTATIATTTATTTETTTGVTALSIDAVDLALGTDRTTGTFTLRNDDTTAVVYSVTFTSDLFGTSTPRGRLAPGATVVVTVDFDRTTATNLGPSSLPEGRFASSVLVTTSSTDGGSTPPTRLVVSGVVVRPPVLAKLALAFGDQGCATLRIRVAITEESALTRVDAVVTTSSGTRTVPLVIGSGTTWIGSISGAVDVLAAADVRVTAIDAWGRTASIAASTTRPTAC